MLERIAFLWIPVVAVSCVRPPPSASDVVDEAVRAVGGRRAVQAARTLVIEGDGERFFLGQGRTPDAELLGFAITGSRRAIDFAARRWRQEQLLTPRFKTGYPDPEVEITALDGEIAFDESGGSAARSTAADAGDRRIELLHSPLTLLQAALDPRTEAFHLRHIDGRELVDLRTASGEVITIAVDEATGLPMAITSRIDQPNLGDVAVTTELTDYRPAGDLRLPMRIRSTLDGRTMSVFRVKQYTVNGAVGDLAAPAAVRAAPAPTHPPVAVEELAPGVWLLRGSNHHSALVELADHLLLIEAPWDEARTLAVIAAARQLRPAKPLSQVVVTHHHFDHSAGLRAAVSQGLTIVAHEKNRRFIESMVARPHRIAPDALARHPRPLALQTVTGPTALGDAGTRVELYPIDTEHADGMLVVHLPQARILIEVDLYTGPRPDEPPPRFYPYAAALVDLVRAHHLDVDRVVPLHREIVSFADLEAAARMATPPR